MIVLALDSGIERTGYALFNKEGNGNTKFIYLTSGLIQTSKTLTTEKRLEESKDSDTGKSGARRDTSSCGASQYSC
ncbi:hypothetical protein A3E69_03220 [Candidatus Roizmanbacteria bacterium RIFCSPHIGHO2_12_FULL_40_130]|nr:MAG: hypothetical protein A3E69_03220 [Candidatus Roizmanbacteria bacterium RIFCSPHIGHO2_12_FULL_40_130]